MAAQRLQALQARIGIVFHDPAYLQQALTHSSYVNERPGRGILDNQRLEFLGDAILDFLVGEWLFLKYPCASEGELTSIRAQIVRADSLARFASEIDLGSQLRLGRGEAAHGGAERTANLCAAFEALVGAIYLDQGINAVRKWVSQFLERRSSEIDATRASKDSKSLLQEHTQRRLHITPFYRIVRESGPDHARMFTAQVLVGEQPWGEGTSPSKQTAEQAAALSALADRALTSRP